MTERSLKDNCKPERSHRGRSVGPVSDTPMRGGAMLNRNNLTWNPASAWEPLGFQLRCLLLTFIKLMIV